MILLYFNYYPSVACWFSNKKQNESGSGWDRRWGGAWKSR